MKPYNGPLKKLSHTFLWPIQNGGGRGLLQYILWAMVVTSMTILITYGHNKLAKLHIEKSASKMSLSVSTKKLASFVKEDCRNELRKTSPTFHRAQVTAVGNFYFQLEPFFQ